MNYRLQLVVGDSALFFMEDWKAGGVEITPEVAGLFDVPTHGPRLKRFEEQLDEYGLALGFFDFMDMMRLGFCDLWQWQGVRWLESDESQVAKEASNRVGRLLADEFRQDPKVQKTLLQLMQAAVRKLGQPTVFDGLLIRIGGREDRFLIDRRGVVAYDRTPHPREFLEKIAHHVSVPRTS